MPGRQPILRGTGQSDADMGGFNILNVGAVGDVQQATLIVEPGIAAAGEVGERGSGLPFSSIAAAVAAAEPGDTILLRPGIHAFDGNIDIFQLPGLFIIGYGAIIKSSSEPNESIKFTIRSSAVTFRGMEFDGDVTDTPVSAGEGCIEVQAPGFTIQDCFIHKQNGYGIHLTESFDFCQIYDCWIEDCEHGIFAQVDFETTANIDELTIKRCNFEFNRAVGVIVVGPGTDNGFYLNRVQISDNQFFRNDRDEGGIPALMVNAACRGVQVHNNQFEDESSGINLYQVIDGSVSGNNLKAIATNGIWLIGCIAVKINDNLIDSRSSAGSPVTAAPILIEGQYAAPNDAAQFVITGNELIFPKTNAYSISISNAGGIIINSNRIEGMIALRGLFSVMVNGNLFSIPQTTQAILIDAVERGSSKISIIGNRFNLVGASISRCIVTVDAAATVIDDILIEGNATPIGLTYGVGTYDHSGPNGATHVVQIGNVPESTNVTLGWINATTSLAAVVENVVFVSQSAGVDATGLRESRTFRFKTINAAITAATLNDTVVVEDGTFNERISARNTITVRFEPSAKLVCTSAGGCIVSTAANQTFHVYHEHIVIGCTQSGTDAVTWTHSGAYLGLHASVSSTGSGESHALRPSNGTIEIWGSCYAQDNSAIETLGGTVIYHGGFGTGTLPDIYSAGTVSAALELNGGTFKATNATISGATNGAFLDMAETTSAIFKQCTIIARGSSNAAINITAGAVPLLRDCVLVSGSSASQCISAIAAQTVKLYGQTVANKGADPPTNITFNGGGTYDVSSSVTAD